MSNNNYANRSLLLTRIKQVWKPRKRKSEMTSRVFLASEMPEFEILGYG